MVTFFSQKTWAGNLTLTWNASGSANVAGYVLSYGTASNTYTKHVDVGNLTSFQLTGLTDGATYYFRVKAYNTGHTVESAYSNEASGTVPVPATPIAASFSASAVSGVAPLTVNFTDNSTGSITSRAWNFGDGSTSALTNPSHTYSAGTFVASLTITGTGGPKTATKTITVTSSTSTGGGGTAQPPATPVTRNSYLVAAYSFDEISGSLTADASGRINHAAVYGPTRSTGYSGRGLVFDGIDDYVLAKDSASLDLSTGYTIEAWVKPASIKTANVITKEKTGGSVYSLYAYDNSYKSLASFNDGISYRNTIGLSQLPVSVWSHLAATYDQNSQSLRLYVNGEQVAVSTYNGTIQQSAGNLRIGGNSIWGEYFKGTIDEVRIYNKALSSTEIKSDSTTAIVAANPPQLIVGNRVLEPSIDSNPTGMAEAFKATPAKTGVITSVNVYLDSTSTATEIVAGVYSDNQGHPGTLLAQGKLSSPRAGATNAVAIPAIWVSTTRPYWLAILAPKGTIKFRDRLGSGTAPMETSYSSVLTTLPKQWSTGQIYPDGPMSVYSSGYYQTAN